MDELRPKRTPKSLTNPSPAFHQSRSTSPAVVNARFIGVIAALSSAVFQGMAPIFGKQAINLGVPPLALTAIRTLAAAAMLLAVMLFFYRRYLSIYPAGLIGCLLAGWFNGIGSLFFYSSLARIDAGIGQLLFSVYPFFLILWLTMDGQLPRRLTILRVMLAVLAVFLLTLANGQTIDPIGIFQMLVASAFYALHIPINQKVLYDMPAPTVTLYTLLAMSSVVVPAYYLAGPDQLTVSALAWGPIAGLTLVTFFSRIALFLGVKHIGGMQTALLGLSELLITLFFAQMFLGESLTTLQRVGSVLLISSLLLVILDRQRGKFHRPSRIFGWLSPPSPPSEVPFK